MAYYKSEEVKRLEQMNVDFDSIDIGLFRELKKGTVGVWIYQNYDRLRERICAALRAVKKNSQPSKTLPIHIREYVDVKEQEMADYDLLRSASRLRRPLSAVAFFASTYDDLQCHDILFGSRVPVEMSRKAENYVRLYGKLPRQKQKQITMLLKGRQEVTHDPIYILKLRMAELAAETGIEFLELATSSKFSSFTRNVIKDFVETPLMPAGNEQRTSSSTRNPDAKIQSALAMMLYMVCMVNQVSADRLLLQDYSRFAVFSNGEELTDAQRQSLSLFLRSGQIAQDMAIQNLILELTDCGQNYEALMA